MKKQKKQNALTMIIIILVVLLIIMIGSIVYEEKINMSKQLTQETISSVKEDDKVEEKNELPAEEEIIEEIPTMKEEYVGEEEQQEEKKQETEKVPTKSNDEKAIELAQDEWGDDKSVTFNIEEKKENIYYVAVKSEATVLQWYEVNIDTWEINEYY